MDIIIITLLAMYAILVHISLIRFKTYTVMVLDRLNESIKNLHKELDVHSERDFFEHRDIYARIDLYHPIVVESNPQIYSFEKEDIKNRDSIECLDDLENKTMETKAFNYINNSYRLKKKEGD